MIDDTISGQDFVIFGIQGWDSDIGGNNPRNIAEAIAKNNRVLFINLPLDRFSLIKGNQVSSNAEKLSVYNGHSSDLRQEGVNLWNFYPKTLLESINWIKINPLFDHLNKRNNSLFVAEIKKAIAELGFENVIVINDNAIFKGFYLKEMLNPAMYIYYMRDFLTGVDYWKYHGKRLEPQLAAKADLTIANSLYYADYLKDYNPDSYFVGQGCDVDHFQKHQHIAVPEELARLEGPVIGYVGAIKRLRLDPDVLIHIAESRPEYNLVLIGAEDEAFQRSRLHQLDNVHFLGFKSMAEVPNYLHHFDVCLNPQTINSVTIGNYPLKIDEYLATGKPVVATRTRAMEFFEEHVYLADSKDMFVSMIDLAIEEDGPELAAMRQVFANSHTWEENAHQIYRAINKKRSIQKVIEKKKQKFEKVLVSQ